MMSQIDWVGDKKERKFKDIRNTRPTVAEDKARLALELGELINTIPAHLKSGGSVNQVREWRAAREAAAKVAGSSRSSIPDLTAAISNMRRVNRG